MLQIYYIVTTGKVIDQHGLLVSYRQHEYNTAKYCGYDHMFRKCSQLDLTHFT